MWSLAAPVVALAAVLGAASAASAQSAIYGAGLQPWVGCWTAEQSVTPSGPGAIVCVTPTADVNVADVATIQDAAVLSRDVLDVTGHPRALDARGCSGTRRAVWSRDSRRVFLRTVGVCQGVPLSTSGILSITSSGEWLDVEGISAAGGISVRVARYRDVGIPTGLPLGVASKIRANDLATWSARTAYGAPLRPDDVIDASRAVDSSVVAAWILERAQRIEVGEGDLALLQQAGVPSHVTDALAAVADSDATLARAAGDAPFERGSLFDRWAEQSWFARPWRVSGYPYFTHPPVVIVRRGGGQRGRGGRDGHGHDAHGGARPEPKQEPKQGPKQPGGAGDPRYAPSAPGAPSQPTGGTVRLAKPRR